jgi:tetratricopeptide (TPR) repeat protein
MKKAQDIFRANELFQKTTECLHCIGNILWLRGDIEVARNYLSEALSSEWSSEEIRLNCKRAFAHMEYKEGSLKRAIELYNDVLEEAQAAGDIQCVARCRIGLIDNFRKLGELEKSLETFRILQSSIDQLDPDIAGNGVRGYAYALHLYGRSQESEEQYRRALELFVACGSEFGQAHCHRGLGDVYVGVIRPLRKCAVRC